MIETLSAVLNHIPIFSTNIYLSVRWIAFEDSEGKSLGARRVLILDPDMHP